MGRSGPCAPLRPHPAAIPAAAASARQRARADLKPCPVKRVALSLLAALLLASPDVLPDPPPAAPVSPPPPSNAADRVPELDAAAHAIASDRALEGAAVGIAVLDVDSGKLLAAVNEHLALNPASNAKLYTAAAALATLHGEHRYETTLTGKLDGDAVTGPLAIRGYGDPSLSTADLWQMVQELKGFGVKRVEGDVLVDQRFYDEQTTPPGFEQQPNEWASFRAPVSAVALDENCITMTVRPGPAGGAARVEFMPPGFVDSEGSVRTADGGGADTVDLTLTGNGSRMSAKVSGAIAGDSRVVRYTRRAEDPRLLAGYALKALLEKSGVEVKGDVKLGTARGHTLAKHLSAPLSSLLYALGKQSDNFYAEMVFKTLAGEGKARPAQDRRLERGRDEVPRAGRRDGSRASSSRTAPASSTRTASRRAARCSSCAGRGASRACSRSTSRSSRSAGSTARCTSASTRS